MNTMTIKCHKK